MARPSKEQPDRRRKLASFRVTDAELTSIDERAKRAGLTRTDYLRNAALKGRIVVQQTASIDPLLIAELNKIGVNLNQLTRATNTTGHVSARIEDLCAQIEEIIMKAIADG